MRKTKVLVTVLLVLMISIVSLAATPKIALIMKTLTNPFFITMKDGAVQAAKDLGVDLIVVSADYETSIMQQVSLIQDMTTQQVDAIVIAPNDSKAVVPALSEAQKAGVHIINIDNAIDLAAAEAGDLDVEIFISADNVIGGQLATSYLAALLGGSGKVAMLEGIPGVENAEGRKAGFLNVVKLFPDIEVVAMQTANWETEQALNVFSNILQAHPDIDGVFCANDMMALGAIQAIEAAGKTGEIYVTSYDDLEAAQAAILEGTMHATVEQNPYLMGYYGVEYALKAIAGEELPDQFMVPLSCVDKALLTGERW
ncbi:MAG: ribose transport system substrate-binding protein [Kosmotogales bacterium]|nr:ribose transport system substrate-binding protein [Kosmotogales bacterium]